MGKPRTPIPRHAPDIAVAMLVKMVTRLSPSDWNANRQASEIKAAIRPYSIAVAPCSSAASLASMKSSLCAGKRRVIRLSIA